MPSASVDASDSSNADAIHGSNADANDDANDQASENARDDASEVRARMTSTPIEGREANARVASSTESWNDVQPFRDRDGAEDGNDWIRYDSIRIAPPVAGDSLATSGDGEAPKPAVLEIEFERETQFYSDIEQDPYELGIFIPTYRLLPVGTLLSLWFELPCGTRIAAPGEVRWIREATHASRPGLGIALSYLSDSARAAIVQFCRENAPLYVDI